MAFVLEWRFENGTWKADIVIVVIRILFGKTFLF